MLAWVRREARASRGSWQAVTRMPQLSARWRITRVTVEESSTTSMLRPCSTEPSVSALSGAGSSAGSGSTNQ